MKTVINILASPRSGSTLLDAMLGNASDAFSLGEVVFWFRPTRKHNFFIDCTCGSSPCPVWEKIKDVDENSFHEAVFHEFPVNFAIDSSKNLNWLIDMSKWVPDYIRIINLALWKDPVDLAFSHWKRGDNLKKHYNYFKRYYSRVIKTNIPFVSIRYKDFVQSPREKLQKICRLISMPYFEGKENFWVKGHHILFGSHGVRQQIRAKKSLIYKKEIWPDDFKQLVTQLQRRIGNDTTLLQVLNTLEKYEVDNIDSLPDCRPDIHRKPIWYYYNKLGRWLRRYFPQDYKIKDVNLIYGANSTIELAKKRHKENIC